MCRLTVRARERVEQLCIDLADAVAVADGMRGNRSLDTRVARRRASLEHRAPRRDVEAAVVPDREWAGVVVQQVRQQARPASGAADRKQANQEQFERLRDLTREGTG